MRIRYSNPQHMFPTCRQNVYNHWRKGKVGILWTFTVYVWSVLHTTCTVPGLGNAHNRLRKPHKSTPIQNTEIASQHWVHEYVMVWRMTHSYEYTYYAWRQSIKEVIPLKKQTRRIMMLTTLCLAITVTVLFSGLDCLEAQQIDGWAEIYSST